MDTGTRASLLDRLKDGADALTWREFFDRYWRVLYAFARRRGASDHTAQDVVQEVMLTVFRQRHVFRYDPARGRFRDWLCAVARNALAAVRRNPQGRRALTLSDDLKDSAPAAPAEDAPDAMWQETFERTLVVALLDVVRSEVEPRTYQAFELTALHGLRAAEAARLTGLTRNAVYLARRRVLQRLRELGGPYRDDGHLGREVKAALELSPGPEIERGMTTRVETAMTAIGDRDDR